jgi:hypothetical protein
VCACFSQYAAVTSLNSVKLFVLLMDYLETPSPTLPLQAAVCEVKRSPARVPEDSTGQCRVILV